MNIGVLVGAALMSYLAVITSKKKNRNQVAWGITCFLFGAIPLIVLYFLKPLPALPENNE